MKRREADTLDWERVYDEYRRPLLLYARQWTPSLADAEDAVQEAFVKVFKRKQEAGAVLPLLYKAIKWCAIDHARGRARRQEREQIAGMPGDEQVALFESGLESEERRSAVEEAMNTLPPEQREVLVMKIWGDLTFHQIARVLGIPDGTAASRYRYALGALRERLKPEIMCET